MHELLKNLQFLFDLPQKLKCAVEDNNYSLVFADLDKLYIFGINVLVINVLIPSMYRQ
jgi:hypothetical protein